MKKDPILKNYAVVGFTVAIAISGWLMMTLTSSPQMKGAAMLWLPAGLQLIAGIWLGPVRGMIAGGLGAYIAGILAYGGWGLPDIVMNLVAGGLVNSFLAGLLFLSFKVDIETAFSNFQSSKRLTVFVVLTAITVVLGLLPIWTGIGVWSYIAASVILSVALYIMKDQGVSLAPISISVAFCVIISFLSACLGVFGSTLAGNSLEAAILQTGVGWFLGDTVSAILGLFLLAFYSREAREYGITDYGMRD